MERAGQFVTEELIHLADHVSSQNTLQSAARLQLPTHTAFHERAEALAPLLQVAAQSPKSPSVVAGSQPGVTAQLLLAVSLAGIMIC